MSPDSSTPTPRANSAKNAWLVVIQSLGLLGLLLTSLLASFIALVVADSNREAVGKEPTYQLRLISLHIAAWDFVACLLAGFAVWLAMKLWNKPQDNAMHSPLSRAICSIPLGILTIFAGLHASLYGLNFLYSILLAITIETQGQEYL
ncbi:MAG: hypothetical protein AAF394_17555 [Planctomycetota bacterium]